MPLIDAPVYVTNSPAVARWLERAATLWLKKYTEAGYPNGPLPQWMFDEQAMLQTLAGRATASTETLGNGFGNEKAPPGLLTVMETAERLGVTRQAVTKWCRQGNLVAIRDGRFWLVDSRSVDERIKSR